MPFDAADLALLTDPDMPGYALATIGGNGVGGLFGNAYHEALGLVGGNQPMFSAPPAALVGIVVGTGVVIGSVSYSVAKIEADGVGLSKLLLERA
jgi:hypothetical protein